MRSDHGGRDLDLDRPTIPMAYVGRPDEPIPDEIDEFLRHLIEDDLPPPRAIHQPEPVARIWKAGASPGASRRPKIKLRRSELDFLLPGIEDLVLPPRKPGAGWGRKKRLYSLLRGRVMDAASSLEFDVLRDLELDPENSWFIEQPLKLAYAHGDRWRTCTPDVLVVRPGYLECLEVKYEKQACLPEREATSMAVGSAFQALGMGYRVITERHVRRQPRFRNVADVFRRRHVPVAPDREAFALAWLRARGVVTIGDIERQIGLSSNEVLALARRRVVAVDLDSAMLGSGTLVRVHTRVDSGLPSSGNHH